MSYLEGPRAVRGQNNTPLEGNVVRRHTSNVLCILISSLFANMFDSDVMEEKEQGWVLDIHLEHEIAHHVLTSGLIP